ncbi:SixA phosphatase family protein [Cellulomonas sp. NS3]|uniref:SixA phosphatase family protein n=1 Tax=Cellulomonas sp. NS3 TaxID=2973977 RepID=UPI002161895D|nr:phosphoglycerate mutase family protein [Cellulomonas sp. NS3]
MFVLVRHAHAGDKHRWAGPDVARPLTHRGQVSAAHVADVLAGLGVTRLLSSPALRCVQTLTPTAGRTSIPIETIQALGVGAPVAELLVLLRSRAVVGAALCTHGETLADLSTAWLGSESVRVDDAGPGEGLTSTPKGACWVVENYPGRDATARYVPPAAGETDEPSPRP